ncbi:hypothetical protein NIES2135_53450 [Leptolyngbya boryana NIES-2135]|jgi:hypothetical protein|uniref:Uncharacterized protein n=1 Tax=Leptolyngbya boryana NIES-2135 TaxID=1973484 RepID=A0A1Z4JNZ1_LEPBY|nr:MULTISPECIES: hypothetical protein [Leptolyngbya]BAY58472.1 hypothetical protein NIES2135_53450 [Leptolyngbya boryana NIES-2135]MBD2370946.1 hypothetical protein [Leptolyngbya sp. FACHB-161]MBD2377460.1 hypothetical protein [Leptolyngbya sp. FACHB-238]MBD2401868.1 hypothetical protein [Leptolyngbya sp. FACHB-239]MBD2408386.1 hypothetical protein [Leptolyngbya sp. FACHB-402]
MPIEDHQFQGFGVGTSRKEDPITVRFPSEVTQILRDKSKINDRQTYIRNAVKRQLIEDGLLHVSENNDLTYNGSTEE